MGFYEGLLLLAGCVAVTFGGLFMLFEASKDKPSSPFRRILLKTVGCFIGVLVIVVIGIATVYQSFLL